jgi:DNA-binding MarR family transcriptional regulator
MAATVTSLLARARRAVRRRFVQQIAVHSDRPVHVLRALYALSQEPSPTQSFLAAHLDLDAPAASRLVNVLEADALISRVPGTDRRCRVLRITARGRRALIPVRQVLETLDRDIETSLGRAQTRNLEDLLLRLLARIEAPGATASSSPASPSPHAGGRN